MMFLWSVCFISDKPFTEIFLFLVHCRVDKRRSGLRETDEDDGGMDRACRDLSSSFSAQSAWAGLGIAQSFKHLKHVQSHS